MIPFISVDDLNAILSQTVDEEALLTTIALDAACDLVRGFLNQSVNLARDSVEYLDGGGTEGITLRQLPVIAVGEVMEGEETLTAEVDYHVGDRSGIIWRIGRPWPLGRGNIKVTYDHGWALSEDEVVTDAEQGIVDRVPSDIRLVALNVAARIWRSGAETPAGTMLSESLGAYSYQMSGTAAELALTTTLTNIERQVLSRWRIS